jgi:hypothetical protein
VLQHLDVKVRRSARPQLRRTTLTDISDKKVIAKPIERLGALGVAVQRSRLTTVLRSFKTHSLKLSLHRSEELLPLSLWNLINLTATSATTNQQAGSTPKPDTRKLRLRHP